MNQLAVPLGELFKISSSKRVLKSQWKEVGVPFYRGREITRLSIDGIVDNDLFISEKHYSELVALYGVPKSGDILITAIGTIGNSYIVQPNDRFYFKDASVLWMKKKKDIDSHFVNLWFKSPLFYNQLDHGNGATVDTLTIQKLQSMIINIPSLAEQKRIVMVLNHNLEKIKKARINAEKNLKNIRIFFESCSQTIFSNALNIGKVVSLSELATDITDGDHMPPPKSETGVPFITIGNISKETKKIDFTNTFKVPQEYFDNLKINKKPMAGDVLYTVTGSFGIPVLVSDDKEFCFQRHIGLIRPKASIMSKWLYYLLMSPHVFNQAKNGATGTAQKTVSLKLLRSFKVPQVSLEQQLEDMAKMDSLSNLVQRLEALYKSKIDSLDELKRSLLHQAFSGKL